MSFLAYLENELLGGLVTVKQLLVIIHLIGLALGAGGAFFFISASKNSSSEESWLIIRGCSITYVATNKT